MKKVKTVKKEKNNDTTLQKQQERANPFMEGIMLPPKVAMQIADEVAKRLTLRMNKSEQPKKASRIENALFLDTSAIIDGRIFDLIRIGAFYGNFVITEGVLNELKNIADSKDEIKRERGRTAMKALEELKQQKIVKITILDEKEQKIPVDDTLIKHAKTHKGRIITCDYNLSKKAQISGVLSIDLYEMANILKTSALPGEEFWIKVIQKGKGENQGVGYLPDGTMIVVEDGERLIGNTAKIEVERVIQTEAGKIFFGKEKAEGKN